MPISAKDLLADTGLTIDGHVPWGVTPPNRGPGVYIVTLSGQANHNHSLLEAPLSSGAVTEWIEAVPQMTLRKRRPRKSDLLDFLASFWLADESILYIGKAECLSQRIRYFFNHKLGKSSPHRGGHWLKALSNLSDLHLFVAECESKTEAPIKETELLGCFIKQVSGRSRAAHANVDLPLPFGNLEWHINGKKRRKQNELRHCTR